MNKNKLAGFLLIAFATVQIPFTVIGVFLIIGVLQYGPNYFLVLYNALATKTDAPPLSQVLIENLPEGLELRQTPQSEPKPETLTTGQGLEPSTDEAQGPIEALPPRVPPAEQPIRRIADLPAYDPVSAFGLGLSSMEDLAIDYVSVPLSPSRHSLDDGPLRIRIGRVAGPRVLVLVGQPGLSWRFEGDVPAQIKAILVTAPKASGEETLIGLPESVPAARFGARRRELPFLLGALPECATGRDSRRAFSCSNLVRDKSTGRQRTAFQIAEERMNLLLGADIASVSAAFADGKDRMILIPEETVDDVVRERARGYLDRHVQAREAEKRQRETLKDYARRRIEDRRSTVLDEVARHEPYSPARIADAHPRVLIVSATGGTAKERGRRAKAGRVKNYEEFLEQQAAKVGSIFVEVKTREPTVIIATATEAVDWRFEFSPGANVQAVHVEGHRSPTVTGVPQEVSLIVRSSEYGDRKVAARVRVLTDKDRHNSETRGIRASLERFQQIYPGSALTIYEKNRLDRVLLTDATRNSGGRE